MYDSTNTIKEALMVISHIPKAKKNSFNLFCKKRILMTELHRSSQIILVNCMVPRDTAIITMEEQLTLPYPERKKEMEKNTRLTWVPIPLNMHNGVFQISGTG